jgi:hypothetical protein
MGYRRFHDHESNNGSVREVQARVVGRREKEENRSVGYGVRDDKPASKVGDEEVQKNILHKEV